ADAVTVVVFQYSQMRIVVWGRSHGNARKNTLHLPELQCTLPSGQTRSRTGDRQSAGHMPGLRCALQYAPRKVRPQITLSCGRVGAFSAGVPRVSALGAVRTNR